MKTFSVIVPIYKVAAYIAETVKSLLNQTFKDFELILVDDGSPDQSANIVESLLSASDLDYQIIHTENKGVSAARNTGIEIAKGEYIIMVDGDDVLSSNFLAVYAELMKKYPEADVYSTSFTVYKENSVIEQPKIEKDIVLYTADKALIAFYNRNPRFLLPTLLLSNEFVKRNIIRFDEQVRYSEDVQFIWRVLAFNKKHVIHSTYSGYKYILHPGSTMTASSVKKILTWCNGFEQLDKDVHRYLPHEIRESFVPMSYFAMLHGAAKMVSFSSFWEIYQKARCLEHLLFNGIKAPSKVKLVSRLTTCFPYLGYYIMKKI